MKIFGMRSTTVALIVVVLFSQNTIALAQTVTGNADAANVEIHDDPNVENAVRATIAQYKKQNPKNE